MGKITAEHQRLLDYRNRVSNWKQWGPYLSERAWGTAREDYSVQGSAWGYFPHDHARSRVYRWNEDGLAGISDRRQYLCFALALWNGQDPILKERLFGLTGHEGNHGEDVKEYYFYLDSTPTHSFMRMLYKYPQQAFPYAELVAENARRGYHDAEYELLDTGIFDDNRYFDVFITYAKAAQDDILITISAANRGADPAPLHLLPTLWFRNTWSWGYPAGPMGDVPDQPIMHAVAGPQGILALEAEHPALGTYYLYAESAESLITTNNETNFERLHGKPNTTLYVKDAFHRAIVDGETNATNPEQTGTKAAAIYQLMIPPGDKATIRLRLSAVPHTTPFADFESVIAQRRNEADEFYQTLQPSNLSADEKRVQRQAFAGMLWSKQLYYYDVEQWINGDPAGPHPPSTRRAGRNHNWQHIHNFDIISMPDKWEYPWYACWDLAFHCLPLVMVDPAFAKRQLELMTREWYMHPNGQLPAYEWHLEDVNPPIHAWATWRVYQIEGKQSGQHDRAWLAGVFHKLLLNFTWWVNRKDMDDNNVFQGGFLGLDNISLFDRSAELPTGGHIEQSDGTAWMGFYALEMMKMALELAKHEPVYQDLATKFYEHFLAIARAMTDCGGTGYSLWDPDDGFFYDALHLPDGRIIPLKVRSLVGLMPLIAVEIFEPELLQQMDIFSRRMRWFTENRPHLSGNMASIYVPGKGKRIITAFLTKERLRSILHYMLDENEFLSPYGIRSLSKAHASEPYHLSLDGQTFSIDYQPAESDNGLFGGNSNWRGPIWFPINYLIIEALQKFHHYYGDDFKVEMPTGSGRMVTLEVVADEIANRLVRMFLRDASGHRPIYGGSEKFQQDPHWRDLILFYEYFHGDNGAGLGASHQTGWTGLITRLIHQTRKRA